MEKKVNSHDRLKKVFNLSTYVQITSTSYETIHKSSYEDVTRKIEKNEYCVQEKAVKRDMKIMAKHDYYREQQITW